MWRNDEDDDFSPPLTPMIDIVFLLLIFFLVATTFLDEERDLAISLPESSEGLARRAAMQPATINIRKDGGLLWRNEPIAMEDLEGLLRSWAAKAPGVGVVLRGDRQTPHQHVVHVLTVCQRAGVRRVSIAVSTQP